MKDLAVSNHLLREETLQHQQKLRTNVHKCLMELDQQMASWWSHTMSVSRLPLKIFRSIRSRKTCGGLDLNGAQMMTIGLGQAKPSMIIQQLIGDQDRNSFQMFYPVSQLNLKMEKGTGTTDHVRIQGLKLQAPYACRILPTSARRLMGALHHRQLPLLKVTLLLLHLALIQLQNHEAANTIPAKQMVPATSRKTKPRVSRRPKISALILAATLLPRTLQARTTTLAASSLAVRIGGLAPSVVMAQLAQLLTAGLGQMAVPGIMRTG